MQHSLFDSLPDPQTNVLPYDGEVILLSGILSKQEAERAFIRLQTTIDWKSDEVIVFNKRIVTRRKYAWYGDKPYSYTYSGIERTALPWTDELIYLKTEIEKLSGNSFNSCLLNFYHDGQDGMGWHSDDEPELVPLATIASLSLGESRRFLFKHKRSGEKREVVLPPGSLLLMKGEVQQHWLHSLPKTMKSRHPRINLTFRCMQNT